MHALLGLVLFLADTVSASDLTIVGIGTSGKEYVDCTRRMKGHATGSGEIRVCLVGNGMYSAEALRQVTEEDWFSEKSGMHLVTQVEEIRFLCHANRARVSRESQTFFPSRSEVEKGRGIRIEIPCSKSPREVRAALTDARKLISETFSNPEGVLKSTKQVADACDTKSASEECQVWRQYIGSIFSGRASSRLTGALDYCRVKFNVGLEHHLGEKPRIAADVPPQDPLDDLDLSGPCDARKLSKWVAVQLPHCGTDSIHELCKSEASRLWKSLEKRGFRRRDDGSVTQGGKKVEISGAWGCEDPILDIVRELHARQSEETWQEAMRQLADYDHDYGAVRATEAEWEDVIERAHFRSIVYSKEESGRVMVFRKEHEDAGMERCGDDARCRLLHETIDVHQMKTLKNLPRNGCYKVAFISPTPEGKIQFMVRPAEPELCK